MCVVLLGAVVDICSGRSIRGVMNAMTADISELQCSSRWLYKLCMS